MNQPKLSELAQLRIDNAYLSVKAAQAQQTAARVTSSTADQDAKRAQEHFQQTLASELTALGVSVTDVAIVETGNGVNVIPWWDLPENHPIRQRRNIDDSDSDDPQKPRILTD